MDGTIFVLSGSERLPKPDVNLGHMLSLAIRNILSSQQQQQQQQFSSSCHWPDNSCEKLLSTSNSNSNVRCQSDYFYRYRGRCNQWRDFGGRFFACTGSLFLESDQRAEILTIPSALGEENEELDCFKCKGKQCALCTVASGFSITGPMDATIPAAGRLFGGDHGDHACGTATNRGSTLQCQHSFLGSSLTGKTSRSHTESNSSLSKKVQAESLQRYKTIFFCSRECFLLSSLFWTLNIPEDMCSKNVLKDFEIWGKASTSFCLRQKLLASNNKEYAAKEQVNFNRHSLCKSILEQANTSPLVALICSKIARHGYLLRGRGAVALLFKTSERENQFTVPEFRVASLSYVYLNESPVNSQCPGRHQSNFAYLCQLYNPEYHYVFSVTVDGYEEVCCNALSFQGDDLVSQMGDDDLVARFCAKLPLYILHSLNLSLDINDHGATLILTPVPGSGLTESGNDHRAREICFINIQQKLRQRGVSLRHQFPEVYRQLCAYTEMNADFAPVSLFLFDSRTRKRFLCLIMPNSEPICSWMEELLEGLGQETVV